MVKTNKKRDFGGTPPIDFLDLSYIMPVLTAAALNDSFDFPFTFGAAFKTMNSAAQLAGRVPRWLAYENFVSSMMINDTELRDLQSVNVTRWFTSLYSSRTYPYIIIGPPIGSLAYLAAVLDAPFLPINYSVAIRHKPLNPDDMKAHIEVAKKHAQGILKNERDIEIVNEYNPIHQRFRVKNGTMLRVRFTSLPQPYEDFIRTHLRSKGTVIVVEARSGWRHYRLGPNLYHQVGHQGGIPTEEFLFGSKRLNMFRSKFLQDEASYRLPIQDEMQPESRFGFHPQLRPSIMHAADRNAKNVCQLHTDDINLINQLVSQLFVRCARREGLRPRYCYIHSGNFIAPSLCVNSSLLPVWIPTPCFPAYQFVQSFLKKYQFPIEEILMSFEPSVEGAPDFLAIDRWREVATEKAPVRFIGMNTRQYPHEMTSYSSYWPALKRWSKKHKQPLSIKVSTDIVVEEAVKCGISFRVTEHTD